uniref:Mitochondrial carrier protein n=1 Tax=Helicotheca tamesis TaxID=374047 RepID=A0A7S2I294_9STRA|mmetsp:Transcript_4934/g.6798  ORF Transcript_4934/g.6798 Transcript_4934/m.6798 type:complete len:335 (+) Transcript_4934:134-1138(+)|eukprot:CAMPEP_0185729740 /NCGR_PEP_ID=MMETSP1171-20130828/7033_1 /TAXON_ID=374046 /ORGANISM="Helicotheca tamensis, Strain CCMP826" /LENGTH=334 /DNA_ID=CAMNT_0028398645 /DNA_START=84 /DNA_END=1088 /DNA_ORIENTATION=+
MQSTAVSSGTKNEGSPSIAVKKVTATPSASIPLPQRMVISAFAGMGAATFCHPLDVIRVQMQTEGAGYKNSLDAGVQIFRRNGLTQGLYAGVSAAYLRQWMYGSFRIGVYSSLLEKAQLKNISEGRDKHDVPFVRKLLMGCTSGAIGSFVGTPSELALVRMSNDAKLPVEQRRNYSNVVDCISRIAKEEGTTKLWRGATPTVLRATLLSACQLGVTSEIKNKLSKSGFFGKDGGAFHGLPVMFVSTLCSSFAANVVANPFDVVKSRMQNMPIAADGSAAYSSMMDCFVKSIKSEGVLVLWSGFTPAFVKLAPYTVISLTLADKLTKAITGKDAL